jgi:DNA-binding response OmpR family regulator
VSADKQADPSSFPKARVLVVDDEAGIRSTVSRFLSLLGYHVDEAPNGEQALWMLKRNRYDVAVLDIRMPGMDGVELMHRAQEMVPELAVVLLTGHASVESAIAALKARATDYLRKPAALDAVATAVASALEAGRPGTGPQDVDTSDRFLRAGPVTLDRQEHVVIVHSEDAAGDRTARLTPSETALLTKLIEYNGRPVSCRRLARLALGYDDVMSFEAQTIVSPHICRLRSKIDQGPSSPPMIRTVRGRGYVFTPEAQRTARR